MDSTDSDWAKISSIVNKIITRSIHKHAFLYFTHEDIAQEIVIMALKAYKSYKPHKGKLENFLSHCILNRLKGLKRDNDYIVQKPCITHKCYFFDKTTKQCKWDKNKCNDWYKYKILYDNKASISSPSDYPEIESTTTHDQEENLRLNEILELATKRQLKCKDAYEAYLLNGKEIPPEHVLEIELLIREVTYG